MQQNHKAGSTYSYAGFDQLVAVSSGIIRHFLAPAQEMYSLAITELGANEDNITSIKPSIQDEVIKNTPTTIWLVSLKNLKKILTIITLGKYNWKIISNDRLFGTIISFAAYF